MGGDGVNNIQSVAADTAAGRDFYLCLGDFLDAFYRADTDMRLAMLDAPPTCALPRENLAFLAAAAHKLSNDNGLRAPDWVFDKKYYLDDKPFFGCKARGNLRLLFMYKSPAEFKHRSLFVDENVLKRV